MGSRALGKAITGNENACDTVDMFSVEEIQEIAFYLIDYVVAHKDND